MILLLFIFISKQPGSELFVISLHVPYLLITWNISRLFRLILDGTAKNRRRKSQRSHNSCESMRSVLHTSYKGFYAFELSKVTRLTMKWRDTKHAKDYFCHEINMLPRNRVSYHAYQRLRLVKICLGSFEVEQIRSSIKWKQFLWCLGIPWGFAISWATRKRYEHPGELAGREDKWCEEERGSRIPWRCGRRDQVEQG